MILVDANLLIYAGITGQPDHPRAAQWLAEQFSSGHKVGLPWPSLLAFLRISTNPRIFEYPASMEQSLSMVEAWLRIPTVWVPAPTHKHSPILSRLLMEIRAQSRMVPDAHLAALAIEHGLELCSTDADFSRFPGLRWRNPLLS